MTTWPHDTTVIRRVRVRGANLDPLTTRLRAGALIGAMDLRAAGVSPATILCVRKLKDPRPGVLGLRVQPGSVPPGWARTTASELDRLAHGAARPAREPVPAGAEAVRFDDYSELLACLAMDCLCGALATCWWWPALFGADFARPIAAWLAHPRYVPAALVALADRGTAREFVQTLSANEAHDLVCAVVDAHQLPTLLAALDTTPQPRTRHQPTSHVQPPECDTDESTASAPRAGTLVGAAVSAPWAALAPEADPTLAREHRLLLGVGLALGRAPHLAQRLSFARDVQEWAVTTDLAPPTHAASMSVAAAPREVPPHVERLAGANSDPRRAPEESGVRAPTADQSSETAAERPSRTRGPIADTICTELGGLFYLVNVGLFLGLYGDFTTPARPGIELPLWDFVTLVGRELLDDPTDADPVWELLAALAGRDPDQPPGSTFDAPGDWRLPREWLGPFSESGAWTGSVGDRLRVEHPAGFVVLDVAADGSSDQLARELEPYGPPRAVRVKQNAPALAPRDRWLGCLLPYVRARVRGALGCAPAEIVNALRARARVALTPAHIDITLSLAELPISVRLAGLDRDPGFVPAAGRVVTFHFT